MTPEYGQYETVRGIGLAATIGSEISLAVAGAAEAAGYHSFWLNNPPGEDALRTLGQVARSTRTVYLGVGIVPLSHTSPEEVVRQVSDLALPLNRFYLGIGSGSGTGGVERVRDAIESMRSRIDGNIVVAALGPRMCRLAGGLADGVLLNWLTPDFVAPSLEWVRLGAQESRRPVPRIMAYVRVALGAEARVRLEHEAKQYAAIPHYAAHFERMGVESVNTAVYGESPNAIRQGLSAWDGLLDEVVIRVIPARNTADDVLSLLEAAKP